MRFVTHVAGDTRARLSLAGYRVLRFTRRQVSDDPDYVRTTVAEALALTGATRS